MSQTPIKLVAIGISEHVKEVTVKFALPDETKVIGTADEFLAFLEAPDAPTYNLIVTGPGLADISVIEIAQSMRAQFPETPMYFCHHDRAAGFDRKDLMKNGFSEAFLLPVDEDFYKYNLEDIIVKLRNLPVFRCVSVVDIQEDTVLDFDLFVLLPGNGKYLKYCKSGQAIEPDRLNRLKLKNVGSVHVPLDQMQKFYDYSAMQLAKLAKGEGMTETQKRERMQAAVRDLIANIFATRSEVGFEEGKRLMNDAKEIVASFMSQYAQDNLYVRLSKAIGEGGSSYSHLSNSSTFAALFSMAIALGDPEQIALAALFHDLGLALVPVSIHAKKPGDWTPEERAQYERHPEYSVNLLKEKRVALPEIVQTLIMQHHEKLDGTGFPAKLPGAKIKLEAQLLAIADEFDELTRFKPGQNSLSPELAFEKMKADKVLNPDLLNKLSQAILSGKSKVA